MAEFKKEDGDFEVTIKTFGFNNNNNNLSVLVISLDAGGAIGEDNISAVVAIAVMTSIR